MKHTLLLPFLLLAATIGTAHATDLYVSPMGHDTCDASPKAPVASLRQALRLGRTLRHDAPTTPITIHVASGTYTLNETLALRPEDSGTPEAPLRIVGEPGATLSGGMTLGGWRKQGKLLVCEVPDWNGYPIDFRQLYVGGEAALRARDVADLEQMTRILCLDKRERIIWAPATPALRTLASQGVGHAEMMLHEMWCSNNLRIRSVDIVADSAAIRLHEPESRIQWEHPWPCPMVTQEKRDSLGNVVEPKHNSAFYLSNHISLLDQPGEWYHDVRSHQLYYYPRTQAEGQQLLKGRTSAIIPAVETLMRIEGTAERPVHDVQVSGLTLCHSTWMRPSTHGHVPLQAGMYLLDGYKLRPQMVRPDGNNRLDNQAFLGRPAAAVTVRHAADIDFEGCTFTQLAATGLDYTEGTLRGAIVGCTFRGIGGSAIMAGEFGPEAHEGHLPYEPADPRLHCQGLVIAGNDIHDVTLEDWGTLGIAAGYVRDITIAYNEIYNVAYSGISLGWGWTQSVSLMRNNQVRGNYIHHYARHLYDVAGIYTLSAQPKTVVAENVVDSIYSPGYVHDPHHWFYLYCDEGSSFITVRDNWTPAEKYLRNANGPNNTWENNGPAVSDSIRSAAGIRPLTLDEAKALSISLRMKKRK